MFSALKERINRTSDVDELTSSILEDIYKSDLSNVSLEILLLDIKSKTKLPMRVLKELGTAVGERDGKRNPNYLDIKEATGV